MKTAQVRDLKRGDHIKFLVAFGERNIRVSEVWTFNEKSIVVGHAPDDYSRQMWQELGSLEMVEVEN